MDESIRFKKSNLIQLDIMDALYLAYHADSVVSVMNGLINSAIFLDYEGTKSPLIHGINTDKYCAHYHLLKSDWENAFVDFPGPPSTWLGGRESISTNAQFVEWNIGTSLQSSDYGKAADSIIGLDRQSPHYVASHLDDIDFPYPQPFNYQGK